MRGCVTKTQTCDLSFLPSPERNSLSILEFLSIKTNSFLAAADTDPILNADGNGVCEYFMGTILTFCAPSKKSSLYGRQLIYLVPPAIGKLGAFWACSPKRKQSYLKDGEFTRITK